jgi:ABC-type multidrug transport system fused ATPase/permease subunit
MGDVELRNVDFAYPSRPNAKVADGLSLLACSGETIALVRLLPC